MRLYTHFLGWLMLFACAAHGQDKMFRRNGTKEDVIVKSVGVNTIVYKHFGNTDGPDYTIEKSDVLKIQYQNGTTDNFDEGLQSSHSKHPLTKFPDQGRDQANIVSVIAGAYTLSLDGMINDGGIGISYERRLDAKGHFSITLPLLMSYSNSRDFDNNGLFYSGSYTAYNNFGTYHSYTFMPGMQFYPAPNTEKVRYSFGASFYSTFGSEPFAIYDNDNRGGADPYSSHNYTQYGFVLGNSLHVAASKHFMISVDVNWGLPVFDNRHQDNEGGLDIILGPWVQFDTKLGYRF